ncbi:MAG: hypothetical protein E4H36_11245, partial [Spirochaetales bacterium]
MFYSGGKLKNIYYTWIKSFLSLCLGILFIAVTIHVSHGGEPWWDADAEKAPIRSRERNKALEAYEAFAAGKYDAALTKLRGLTVSPDERTSLETMIRIWEKRRSLGTVNPSFVYKALVININSVDVTTQAGKHVTAKMTEKEKDLAELYQELTKKTYEAFSNGEMTIDFEPLYIDDTLTSLSYPSESGMEFPRLDSIPGLPELLRKKMGGFDILVVHSPGGITGTALGGEWAVPYIEYALYGPRRGRLILNTAHNYGIWVHELFHSLEGHGGISPIHGYYSEPRLNFPDWHGVSGDQFDYFDWHFGTTLKKTGYRNLSFYTRYQDPTTDRTFSEVMEKYRAVPIPDRYEADRNFMEGRKARDPVLKEELLKKAVSLSPLHSSALYELGELYMSLNRHGEAYEAYAKTAEYFPRPSVFLGEGLALIKLGDIDGAMASFEKGIMSFARDSVEQNRLGECYYQLAILTDKIYGDKAKAYAQALKAIENGFNFVRSRELLASLQTEKLSYDETLNRYKKLLGESREYAHILMV